MYQNLLPKGVPRLYKLGMLGWGEREGEKKTYGRNKNCLIPYQSFPMFMHCSQWTLSNIDKCLKNKQYPPTSISCIENHNAIRKTPKNENRVRLVVSHLASADFLLNTYRCFRDDDAIKWHSTKPQCFYGDIWLQHIACTVCVCVCFSASQLFLFWYLRTNNIYKHNAIMLINANK